jgi:hypothetical protein
MNNELRKKIIKVALQQGLKHESHKHGEFTVDSYFGNVMVKVDGSDYQVQGRKAQHHTASYTNGYVSIQRKTIGKGLY